MADGQYTQWPGSFYPNYAPAQPGAGLPYATSYDLYRSTSTGAGPAGPFTAPPQNIFFQGMVPTRPGPASPSGNKGDGKKPRSPSKKPKKKPKGAADKEEQAKKKAEKKRQQEQQKQQKIKKQEQEKKRREKEKEQVRRQKMKSDKTKSGKKKKERDPSAPKRARTAFNFFLDEFRVEYKKTNPEAKGVVEVTQSGSAKWKVMSPKEKEPFETKALQARAKYQKDKEEYERAGGQAKFKLRQAPPRPPTAYFMFLGQFRKEFKLKNPEVKGIKDMSKEAGAKWRDMDKSEKEPYEEKAKAAKQEYNRLKEMTPEERIQATAHITSGKIYDRFM